MLHGRDDVGLVAAGLGAVERDVNRHDVAMPLEPAVHPVKAVEGRTDRCEEGDLAFADFERLDHQKQELLGDDTRALGLTRSGNSHRLEIVNEVNFPRILPRNALPEDLGLEDFPRITASLAKKPPT